MKTMIKDNFSVLFALLGGCVGLLLRLWRLRLGVDETGLLVRGHMGGSILIVWSLLIIAALLVLTKNDKKPNVPNAGASRLADVLVCLYVAVQTVLLVVDKQSHGVSEVILTLLSLLAVIPMLGAVVGKKANHILLCVYAVALLIFKFRAWSLNPQLANYSYQLLAGVTLMFATYHRAAFDGDMGHPVAFRRWSLLCAYLCMVSMTDENMWFYLTMAVWLLCGAIALPHKTQNMPQPMPQCASET